MTRSALARLIILLTCFLSAPVQAWEQSIEIGAGASHDPNDSKHDNYGILISGDFLPLYCNAWARLNLNAALGQWFSTAPVNKNVTTIAASLALRMYPFTMKPDFDYTPYLLATLGPAVYSNSHFGMNNQGGNIGAQVTAGLGFEYDDYDFNLRAVHYSNAGTNQPNNGYNILYVFSVGYLFW